MSERPTGARTVLLALRFLAELGMLAALAWGGWHLVNGAAAAIMVAVALPLLAAAAWGRWVAPRAGHRLPDPARAGVEVLLFLTAFVVLTQARPHPETIGWGLALLVAYALSMPARRVELLRRDCPSVAGPPGTRPGRSLLPRCASGPVPPATA